MSEQTNRESKRAKVTYVQARTARFNSQGMCACGKEPLSSRTMGKRCLARLRLRASRQRERLRGWADAPRVAGRRLPKSETVVVASPIRRDGYNWPELIAMELERQEQEQAELPR